MLENLRKFEQDVNSRIKEQRDAQSNALIKFEEEKIKLMKGSGDRTEDNSQMLKSMLTTIEHKMEEEVRMR